MAQQDAFALGRSNLNGFLFANIGVEGSGMPLSVISALARQDLDPWQEAGRLAKLPQKAATDGLARLIAALPASLWPMPDATPIAARLVALLPRQDDRHVISHPVVLAARPAEAEVRPSGPWLIATVLTMALLAGLAAYVTPASVGPAAASPITAVPTNLVPTGG